MQCDPKTGEIVGGLAPQKTVDYMEVVQLMSELRKCDAEMRRGLEYEKRLGELLAERWRMSKGVRGVMDVKFARNVRRREISSSSFNQRSVSDVVNGRESLQTRVMGMLGKKRFRSKKQYSEDFSDQDLPASAFLDVASSSDESDEERRIERQKTIVNKAVPKLVILKGENDERHRMAQQLTKWKDNAKKLGEEVEREKGEGAEKILLLQGVEAKLREVQNAFDADFVGVQDGNILDGGFQKKHDDNEKEAKRRRIMEEESEGLSALHNLSKSLRGLLTEFLSFQKSGGSLTKREGSNLSPFEIVCFSEVKPVMQETSIMTNVQTQARKDFACMVKDCKVFVDFHIPTKGGLGAKGGENPYGESHGVGGATELVRLQFSEEEMVEDDDLDGEIIISEGDAGEEKGLRLVVSTNKPGLLERLETAWVNNGSEGDVISSSAESLPAVTIQPPEIEPEMTEGPVPVPVALGGANGMSVAAFCRAVVGEVVKMA